MGLLLFWTEYLAATLLLLALLAACLARLGRQRLRLLLATLLLLTCMVIHGGAAVVAGIMRLRFHMAGMPFFPLALVALTLLAAGLVMTFRSLRERGGNPPAARQWPRGWLALACAVAALLAGMTLWNLDLTMRNRLATMRMEAGAMALSVAPTQVSDRDNAALVYQQAFERMTPSDKWPPHLLELVSELDKPLAVDDAAAAALLDEQAEVLKLLREAAAMPDCFFDHNYAQPSLDMLLPEIGELRQVARLLSLSARRHASAGKAKDALADVSAIFGISEHAARQPLLISMLVGIAVHRIAAGTLEQVLRQTNPTEADLAALALNDRFTFARALQRSLVMEEAFGLSAFTQLSDDADFARRVGEGSVPQGLPHGPGLGMMYRVFLLPDDLLAYRELMAQHRHAATLPWPLACDQMDYIEAGVKDGQRGFLTALLVPALSAAAQSAFQGEASHRLAQVAQKLASLRAADRLPASADQLAAALGDDLLSDPFDGKPLRIKVTDTSVVLYSIGPDGKDDGAKAFDSSNKTGDIAFTLKR